MAQIVYTFTQTGQRRSLLIERVLDALYSAVIDLDEQRAELEVIRLGEQVLYDRAALERVWAACRAEQEANIWQVPAALDPAGRRELRPSDAP
jgi:hypothetical protein